MKVNPGRGDDALATSRLRAPTQRALADPERFYLVLEQRSEGFARLMAPISAALLSLGLIAVGLNGMGG